MDQITHQKVTKHKTHENKNDEALIHKLKRKPNKATSKDNKTTYVDV